MQPRHYLLLLRKRWLTVLVAFVATSVLTFLFVMRQPDVYESRATFVVRPRAAVGDDSIRATDTLIRGVEINSTYAAIVRSSLIRSRAEDRLSADVDVSGLTVGSKVITETNIIEVTVRGQEREPVQRLTEAVGAETISYVSQLNYEYELEPLDAAALPSTPVAPNRPLTIATGIILGAAVGIVLALLVEGVSRTPAAARLDDEFIEQLISTRRAGAEDGGTDNGTSDDRDARRQGFPRDARKAGPRRG